MALYKYLHISIAKNFEYFLFVQIAFSMGKQKN